MAKNKKGWFLLSCYLGFMSAMPPLATDMYLPALPVLQSDFGITTSMVQLTMTMTLVGMALGQIFAGPISDMVGRKRPLAAGMSVFALASLGCCFVEDIYLFLLLRLIQGLAGSCGVVISKAIARDVSSGAELTKFFALLMMINGLAPILAPVVGGQVLNLAPWRGIFLLLTIIAVLMLCCVLYSQETLPVNRRQTGIKSSLMALPGLLQNKYFAAHCFIQSSVMAGFFAYIGCSAFVFQEIYHVSAQEFSFIFALIGVSLMVSGILPAKLAGRVPDEQLLKYALLLPALASVLLIGTILCQAPLWAVILTLMLSVMPLSIMGAAGFSMAMCGQGRQAGSASALLGFFPMFVGGIAMPVSGMLSPDPSLPMAAFLLGGWTLGFIGFKLWVEPAHKDA